MKLCLATITAAIDKRVRSCGFTFPKTPGKSPRRVAANLWSCESLVDARGVAVGPRWFWVENGALKMGRVRPGAVSDTLTT